MADLKLQIILNAIDKATAPFRAALTSSNALARSITGLRGRLKELGQQQKLINNFSKLKIELAANGKALDAAKTRASALAKTLEQAEKPSRAMTRYCKAATKEVEKLSKKQADLTGKALAASQALGSAGISTKSLASAQASLNKNTDAASAALKRQEAALVRMARARQQLTTAQSLAGGMVMSGYAGMHTGKRMLGALTAPLHEAKEFEINTARTRALGMGDDVTNRAVAYANKVKAFGLSANQSLELMRDSLMVFADEHHAVEAMPVLTKMRFSSAAMFGSGSEAAQQHDRLMLDMMRVVESRGATNTDKEFNAEADWVTRIIASTGGRVQAEDWRQTIARGGLAAKLMDSKAFYTTLEPLVQEWGGAKVGVGMMSAYQNLYQGKLTKRAANNLDELGLIADRSKVTADKTGHVKFLDPGALKGSELYRSNPYAWVKEVLLPAFKEKGITDQKDMLDAVGSIVTNRTGADFIGQMIKQQTQLDRSIERNERADGIDALYEKAKNTTEGKELEYQARLSDTYLKLSQTILPLYVAGMEKLTSVAQSVTEWMGRHQFLAKALIIVFAGLAVGLTVFGALTFAVGSFIGPLALARYGLQMFGIRLGMLLPTAGNLSAALSLLKAKCLMVGSAIRSVGTAIMVAGRMMLTSPIGWLLAGIAFIALLIIHYWEPIKAFFGGVFDGIAAAVQPVLAAFAPLLDALKPFIDVIGGVISHLAGFLVYLSEPAQYTKEELNGAANAGQRFGAILGGVFRLLLQPIADFVSALMHPRETAQQLLNFFVAWSLYGVIAGHWDRIKSAAAAAWSWVRQKAIGAGQALTNWFLNWTLLGIIISHWDEIISWMGSLPARFMELGAQIINGLLEGISTKFGQVKSMFTSLTSMITSTTQKGLEVRSPSRVFARIGGWVMQGLELGIVKNQAGPISAVMDTARRLTDAGAALMFNGAPTFATPVFAGSPPGGGGQDTPSGPGGSTYNINLYGVGGDPRQIEAAVRQAISKLEAERASRRRSAFSDKD